MIIARSRATRSHFRSARYQIASPVLPRVTETVSVAERVRIKLMGIHRRIMDGDPHAVSPVFSGKEPDGSPARGHRHAFILPMDEDGDGRIDHVEVHARDPFRQDELEALDRARSIWQPDGRPDATLTLVSLNEKPTSRCVTRVISATPFVTTRHHRRGRGPFLEWLTGELVRECGHHGLPRPAGVDFIEAPPSRGRTVRWMEFLRSRKDGRPMRGYGFALTFDEPIEAPFAIGALCHYGLGLFVPDTSTITS